MHPKFGSDMTFEKLYNSLQPLLETAKNLKSTDIKMELDELYLKKFGIAHLDHAMFNNRPLAQVAMHSAEDPLTGSALDERMTEFADLDIHGIFGCSWSDFLQQPHDDCERMLEIARPRRKREIKALENSLNDIGKLPK